MGLFDFIGDLVKPITGVIQGLDDNNVKKLELENAIVKMQIEMSGKVLDYEKQLMDAQASIIKAEAQGASWIQRSWRPITMLAFLGLVVCDSFGWLPNPLAREAWTLLQIGLGGYVIGRSAEKAVPAVTGAIKANKS